MSTILVRAVFGVAITVAAIIAWSLLLNAMKGSTLFFPERYPSGFWEISRLPIQPTEHWIKTPDGVRLHSLLFLAPDQTEGPVVIHYHGNGGNLSYRIPIAEELAARGVTTLLFDYRGYGRSEGRADEKDLEIDSLAVYDYVKGELAVRSDRIALFGESLGGAYAAFVASQRPACCIVIESSFPSAKAVAGTIYPIGPLLFPLNGSLTTSKWLARSSIPVLVFHGTADEVIDFRLGRQLYDSIGSQKEFITIEGAGHNDVLEVGGAALYDRIATFVRHEKKE